MASYFFVLDYYEMYCDVFCRIVTYHTSSSYKVKLCDKNQNLLARIRSTNPRKLVFLTTCGQIVQHGDEKYIYQHLLEVEQAWIKA